MNYFPGQNSPQKLFVLRYGLHVEALILPGILSITVFVAPGKILMISSILCHGILYMGILFFKVGLGESENELAKDFILVLVNVCLAHLYNNSFPLSEKTIEIGISCIDKFSNTVSLSASRLLFNMVIQMEKVMDDEQCTIASALLEKLTEIQHVIINQIINVWEIKKQI